MKHSAEARRIAIDLDVDGFRKLWPEIFPHLPPAENDIEILIVMHTARTQMESVPIKLRQYSHCWLRERGRASGLPDWMRPSAERMYPSVVGAVGIAVKYRTEESLAIRAVMEDAVRETYADGYANQPDIVKARMLEKRAELKKRM